MLDKTIVTQLAEWSTTFDIVGPWTLLKLPSDGSEHKTPAEKKAEDVKKQRENKINNYATMIDNFREKLENMVIKYMEMDGGEHDEKVDLVLNFLDAQYNNCKRDTSRSMSINSRRSWNKGRS